MVAWASSLRGRKSSTSLADTVAELYVCTREARLVDPTTGEDVKPGEEGELWVRGPQVMM